MFLSNLSNNLSAQFSIHPSLLGEYCMFDQQRFSFLGFHISFFITSFSLPVGRIIIMIIIIIIIIIITIIIIIIMLIIITIMIEAVIIKV